MCLWKMPPSVNRKFALFAIFFEKSAGFVVNMLILLIFIVFMQKLPQSCTAGFPAAGFWAAGPATSGRSRRARHERRAGVVQTRKSSAERSRSVGGSGGKSAFFRTGVLPFTGFCLSRAAASAQPSLRDRVASSFVHGDFCGRGGLPAEDPPVCPRGRAVSGKKKSCPRRP